MNRSFETMPYRPPRTTHPHRPPTSWAPHPARIGGVEVRYQEALSAESLASGREIHLGSLAFKLIPGGPKTMLQLGTHHGFSEGMRLFMNGEWADFSTPAPTHSTPPGKVLARLKERFPEARFSGEPVHDAVAPHVHIAAGAQVDFSHETRLMGECWISGQVGPGAQIRDSFVLGNVGPGAVLDGACVLGRAQVGRGASLIRSGLDEAAVLGAHSQLRDSVGCKESRTADHVHASHSILGPRSDVGAHAVLDGAALGDEVAVGARASIHDRTLPAGAQVDEGEALGRKRPQGIHPVAHPPVKSSLRQLKHAAANEFQTLLPVPRPPLPHPEDAFTATAT